MTMQGAVFTGDREVELRTFDDPEPGPGEVIVAVKASGMCGSDLHYYRVATKDAPANPTIAGHEPAGVVAAVGPGVDDPAVAPGQRVMVHHYAGCGACDRCRSGWPQMCTETAVQTFGSNAHGAHAPYLRVPASALVPLPDDLSFAVGAAIGCGTGTAWNGLQRLGDVGGSDVLIFGQGPVGLSATILATALGARVIAVDLNAARRATAESFGATATIDPAAASVADEVKKLTGARMAPFILETSGSSAASSTAVECAGQWGRICLIGLGGRMEFAVRDVFHRQLTVMTSWTMSRDDQKRCAEFVVERSLPIEKLFSHHWRLDQVSEAYKIFDAQDAGKGVIEF
jgi:2-desacetyl-2-hydroxyethyl bacteriochlorophyllide A dehydrogenase